MEGSPHRKKARFSQHPQVFQYSSQGKKQSQLDNESLLIGDEQQTRQQQIQKVDQSPQIDSNAERLIEIDQISSDLAQIQAFLQQESKPLEKYQQPSTLTPNKNNQQSSLKQNQRFSVSIKPQLRTGRQTMNLQQQIRVRSTLKQLPDEMSNNKKRMLTEQSKQKTIEERIQNQLNKKKRITMDVKELLSMINQGGNDEISRKVREQRRNRITMDVFALTKLIQNEQQQNQDKNQSLTPIKTIDKSLYRNKVFSAFKQNPHSIDIKLFINSYINQAPKRLQQKQIQNKRLTQYIAQLKSELVKTDLKISDAKKRLQKRTLQNQQLERKIKLMNEELNQHKYVKDLQFIQSFQIQNSLNILRCEVNEEGCYGHIIFDGIFLKIKSKTKNGPTDIKLLVSQQARQNQKFFLISIQDAVKIVKKHHSNNQERGDYFIDSIIKIRRAYQKIQKLDCDLYYLSLVFQLKQFEFNAGFDKLSFLVFINGERNLLIQINLTMYLNNRMGDSVSLYDPKKPGFLDVEIEVKEDDSVVFEKIRKIYDKSIL